MKGFLKAVAVCSLILFLLSACNMSGDSGGGTKEKEIFMYLEGELFTGSSVDINQYEVVNTGFLDDDGNAVPVTWSFGEGEAGLLEAAYTDPLDNSRVNLRAIAVEESTCSLHIFVQETGKLLRTINFNISVLPYIKFPDFGNFPTIDHGEASQILFHTNMESSSITWSVTGNNGNIVLGDITDSYPKEITVEGWIPGESLTLTAASADDSAISDSYEIAVRPRDVKILSSITIPGVMDVGDTLNIDGVFSVEYSVTPDLNISGPEQNVTTYLANATVSDSGGILSADTAGRTVFSVLSDYNTEVQRDFGIRVLGTESGLSLTATVTDGNGSYAVEGSRVTLFENGSGTAAASEVSAADGTAVFTGLSTGYYDLEVSGGGRAASRLEHLLMKEENRTVEIVQKEIEAGSWPIQAPSIDPGISDPYLFLSDIITITASVNPGNTYQAYEGRYVLGCYLIAGEAVPHRIDSVSDTSLEIEINPAFLTADVFSELSFVAYDINNNRTEYRIPLESTVTASHSYIPGDNNREQIDLLSHTFGTQNNVYSAAPGSYHSVRVAVERGSTEASIDGIMVYRSTDPALPGSLIGTSTTLEDGETLYVSEEFIAADEWFYFSDRDPALKPGETYYYSVSYVKDGGEGERSVPLSITLLPSYNLELTSPQDDHTITGIPTFEWEVNADAQAWSGIDFESEDTFLLIASDNADIYVVSDDPITDGSTSLTLQFSLPLNKRYEWDIMSQRTIENSSAYTHSLSISMPRILFYSKIFSIIAERDLLSLSNNGSFSFYQE